MKKAVATAVALGALAAAPAQAAVVAGGPGDQTNPHLSGSLVEYTSEVNGGSAIGYRDLATGATGLIPNGGAFDFLGDVDGTLITFTRVTDESTIWRHDVATGQSAEVAPQAAGTNRRAAALGGGVVAWQDLGFGPALADTEIVAHDLATGQSTRLSADAVLDKNPAVAPGGDTIVWTKCASLTSGCDVFSASRGLAGWAVTAITGADGEESLPDTDGTWTVYASARDGDQDIHVQPDGGGPVRRLALPSIQRNPNVDRGVVTFESFDEAMLAYDLWTWDLMTGEVRRLTDTPVDESLNAVSVAADGLVRAAWTAHPAVGDGFDVLATSFQRPPTDPPALVASVQQPIDADGTSTFNARRGVVPVRFTAGTCDLPPATIRVTRIGSAGDEAVDESVYSSQADAGSAFRIEDCAYRYNLAASALGAGRYRVEAIVDGSAAGAGEFTLG